VSGWEADSLPDPWPTLVASRDERVLPNVSLRLAEGIMKPESSPRPIASAACLPTQNGDEAPTETPTPSQFSILAAITLFFTGTATFSFFGEDYPLYSWQLFLPLGYAILFWGCGIAMRNRHFPTPWAAPFWTGIHGLLLVYCVIFITQEKTPVAFAHFALITILLGCVMSLPSWFFLNLGVLLATWFGLLLAVGSQPYAPHIAIQGGAVLLALLIPKRWDLRWNCQTARTVTAPLPWIHRGMESTGDAVLILNPQEQPVYGNPAFTQLIEYPIQDLKTTIPEALFFGSNFRRQVQLILQEGHSWNSEERILTRTGEERIADIRIDPIRDDSGAIQGVICVLRDITQRKANEQDLQKRLAFEQFIANISTQFINLPVQAIDANIQNTLPIVADFVHADRCIILLFSKNRQRIETVFEWCPPSIPPERDYLLQCPISPEEWWIKQLEKHHYVGIDPNAVLPAQAILARAVYERLHAHSFLTVPLRFGNQVIGLLGVHTIGREKRWTPDLILLLKILGEIFTNAWERKKAENAWRASEESLQDFLDNASDLIQSVTPDGKFRYVNRAWLERLEYRPDEIDSITLWDIIHPEYQPHCLKVLEAIFRGESMQGLEVQFVTKSGRVLTVSGNINCRFEKGIPVATRSIFRDITESKQAALQLQATKEAAEAANIAKSQFLATMSHELRTPLNAIIGFTKILLEKPSIALPSKEQTYLQRILTNGCHLLHLINDILDLSMIEAGRVQLDWEMVQVPSLLQELRDEFEDEVCRKGIIMEHDLPDTVRPLRTDRQRLKQILLNLLDNAIKFTEEGSIRLELKTGPGHHLTHIVVRDTGIGIPAERLETIFDRFQQGDPSTSRKYGGTGLGLAICKSLCDLMGYTIFVESEENRGSTFTIQMNTS
jgi:PAS domain S-box-containing protein